MQHRALPAPKALSPRDAAWLADTMARNQNRFGGWSMEQTDPDPGDKGGDDPKPDPKGDDPRPGDKPEDKGDGDKPLGENGEKALKAERDARKALEGQLSDLKKGLAAALGLGDEADKGDDDALEQIQAQIAEIKHEKRVLELANDFRITDKDDLALLSTITDEAGMKKLAERLAPAEEERDAKSRRPKPDRSQAGGGSDSGQSGGKTVAQVMAERRAARADKAKSTT